MALVLKDRVLETCTSPGTGTVTLLGAVTGYQSFSTVGNGNTCYYAIADQNGANFEVGIGTYSSAGTLARTTVLSSSNSSSLVNFSTGSQNVFLTYPSSRSVNLSSAALTSGRVTFATTDGLLTDSANLVFTGTNLGVGTSSPSYVLDVSKTTAGDVARFTNGAGSNKEAYIYTGSQYVALSTGVSTQGVCLLMDATNNLMQNQIGSNILTTLNASGNLGLGVTPSAWGTVGYIAMQFPSGGSISGYKPNNAPIINLSSNLYYDDTNNRYVINGASTSYDQQQGVHSWRIAASGTAGNIITFTQAMTLDASGDLVVGGTSPDVFANGFNRNLGVVALSANSTASINVSGTVASRIQFGTGSTRYGLIYQDASNFMQIGTVTALPISFVTNTTERMRIDSAGRIGFGTGGSVADRLINAGFSGVTTTGGTQFGFVFNPTYPNTATANIYHTYFYPNLTAGTTLTNLYNLYLEANNITGSTVANSYGVYQAGSNDKNYFAGNVGIGTTSMGRKLNIAAPTAAGIQFQSTGTGARNFSVFATDSNASVQSSFAIFDDTASAYRVVLDSSGNLGLGVTPSDWYVPATYRAVQVGQSSFVGRLTAGSEYTQIFSNAFVNAAGAFKYIFNGTATIHEMLNGSFRWLQAPSGTAGDTATFTQAMTLNASGQLLVGDTSGNGVISARSTSAALIEVKTTTGTSYAALEVVNTGGSMYIGRDNSVGNFFGAGTGYASCLYSSGAYPMAFFTNGTERARIDSAGALLVGTSNNTTNGGFILDPHYNGTGISNLIIGHPSAGANGNQYMIFNYNGTGIGSITQSGTSAVLYNVTSDQRLKTNVVDAPSGNIDNIKIRSFNWIADGSHQEYGMVAQELIEVAPYAVYQPLKPEEMMAVDYSKLVPMMIKEIQDLKAEVNQLKAKIGV